jgi:hypothetical protein
MARPLWRLGLAAAIVLALLGVFALYLQPELAVTLANQIWNCF